MPDSREAVTSEHSDAPPIRFQRDWPAFIAEVRARHRQGDDGADRSDDTLILATEVERLRGYLMAIAQHGGTTWADSSMGSGGIGGQTLTHEDHGEVIQHLVSGAFIGDSLETAADMWDRMIPGCTRLDGPAAPPRRRGPDGRPR